MKKLVSTSYKKLPIDYINYRNKNILIQDCDENDVKIFLNQFEIKNNINITRLTDLNMNETFLPTLAQAEKESVVFINLEYGYFKMLKYIKSAIENREIFIEDTYRTIKLTQFFFIIYFGVIDVYSEFKDLFDIIL